MTLGEVILLIGITLNVGGFMAEIVAFLGMAYYPIRRVLPFKSPLELQALGCLCVYVGLPLVCLGQGLR